MAFELLHNSGILSDGWQIHRFLVLRDRGDVMATKESIRQNFPLGITFPDELGMLCDWLDQNGYPISGHFELRAGDGEDFYWWFRSHDADDRLALFGVGPDGSMVCIWKQDDGRQPVVHLGSEGDQLKVLADDMGSFLVLLAIGYGEIGHDDLSQPPRDARNVNPKFRMWVEQAFDSRIPETGIVIQSRAQVTHEDFAAWVASIPREDEG